MSDDHKEDWCLRRDLIWEHYEPHGPPPVDQGPVPTQDVLALAELDTEKAAHLLEDLYNIAHRLAQEVVIHRLNNERNGHAG